jgi:hypothetical protein
VVLAFLDVRLAFRDVLEILDVLGNLAYDSSSMGVFVGIFCACIVASYSTGIYNTLTDLS